MQHFQPTYTKTLLIVSLELQFNLVSSCAKFGSSEY